LESTSFTCAVYNAISNAKQMAILRVFTAQYCAYVINIVTGLPEGLRTLRELFFTLQREALERTRARYYSRVLSTRFTRAMVSNAIPPCGSNMRADVLSHLSAMLQVNNIMPAFICDETLDDVYDKCVRSLDLSFFLHLNYGIDVMYLYKFSECVGATTLGAALLFFELQVTNFLSTYFMSAANSAYINNICYIDKNSQLISIGDFIELRAQSVYTDLLLIVLNVMHMCSLVSIKKQ
jgi:hypothetical protein